MNPTYLSAKGPKIIGPSTAMNGAATDIMHASLIDKPIDLICTAKNGNRHPTPETSKKHD